MAELFKQAGLKNIAEKEVPGKINCQSAEQYWDFMTEIAAPFVAALSDADEETVEKIKIAVIDSVNEKYPNKTSLDTSAIIISAEK